MMAVKKASKSPSPTWREDQSDPKNDDRGGGGTLFREYLYASGKVGFGGYIRGYTKGGGEATSEAQMGLGVRHLCSFGACVPPPPGPGLAQTLGFP